MTYTTFRIEPQRDTRPVNWVVVGAMAVNFAILGAVVLWVALR